MRYATTYIRVHLAIYTFFQRTGIIPLSQLLPGWRFFIPGTSTSPIPIPALPSSFRPRSLLQWLGAFAVGVAPFAGFYLYTKLYSVLLRTLRFKIHQRLPRPYNTTTRRHFHERTPPPGPEFMPVELRTEETLPPPTHDTSTDTAPRRQSTSSLTLSLIHI